jgi:hypothetical protein
MICDVGIVSHIKGSDFEGSDLKGSDINGSSLWSLDLGHRVEVEVGT